MIIVILVLYSTDFYKYENVVYIFSALLVTVVIKMLFWVLIVRVHHIIKHKMYLSELGENGRGSNSNNPEDNHTYKRSLKEGSKRQTYDPRKSDSRPKNMSYDQQMRRERPLKARQEQIAYNSNSDSESPEDKNRSYNSRQNQCCCSKQQNNGPKLIICCPKDKSYEQPLKRERPIDDRRQQMAYNSNSQAHHNDPPTVTTKNGSVILQWRICPKRTLPNKRYN